MKMKQWLNQWGMTSLKIKSSFLEMEFKPQKSDKDAAWELYVELLTRITTQPIDTAYGDEKAALDSIYSLFAITRQILKTYSRECEEFAKISIVVLNQVVRPFTAKWHKLSLASCFTDEKMCKEFREELFILQNILRKYTQMLAAMADVEDLTELEAI